MLSLPKKATLVSGSAEGATKLNALDNALIDAGIGDFNLIKVSSILPKGTVIVDLPKIEAGTLVPCVLAKRISDTRGQKISASIVVALSENGMGVIAENSGAGISKGESYEKALEAARNMLMRRGLKLKEIRHVSREHTVENIGAVVAALVFFR
ncbi:MAG: pyruvoyl-dependent arginine decarboxylase [Candidatus Hydrothermarchaeota archaeon]